MSVTRHYFPGNNTPKGFFSYYNYILSQREANAIVCIKGGPGTGKSSFLKAVGKRLEDEGFSMDYLHCSADADSLDGIVITDRKIAFVDGTSPHVIDPVTPGAVDTIINFGEFWDEKEFDGKKEEIIKENELCSSWYAVAYNYLSAAASICGTLSRINNEAMEISEVYRIATEIIEREYKEYDISYRSGKVKKFFATGITPDGNVSYIKSLLTPIKNVYLINVPEGYRNSSFLSILLEGALYRGFDVECFYCPMDPENKLEHFIVPELSLAFVTTNKWHDIEAWEIPTEEEREKEITLIDIGDYRDRLYIERESELMEETSQIYAFLIRKAIKALEKAKEVHDRVEATYVKSMDFDKVNELVDSIVEEMKNKEQ